MGSSMRPSQLSPIADMSPMRLMTPSEVPLLRAWWTKTRSWNVGISKRDQWVRRLNPSQPGGGVVIGDGRCPIFNGSHLMTKGYFYAFRVEGIDDVRYPLGNKKVMSFGF